MTANKSLGVWMDHSRANLIEFHGDVLASRTIESKFTPEVMQTALLRSEHSMHQKEQRMDAAYYQRICDAIANFENVLLFGPTEAKQELFNYLRADKRFDGINVSVVHADKMTEQQQHAFVKDHFSSGDIKRRLPPNSIIT
jgi:hypothetical protein